MKKLFGSTLLVFVLLLTLALSASAAGSVRVTLSPDKPTARAGDTVAVSVNLSGVSAAGGVAAAGVNIIFDTAKFTYSSASIGGGKPAGDLKSNTTGNTVRLVYCDGSGRLNGYSSNAVLAVVRFRVKSGITSGSASFTAAADGFGNKNANPVTTSASGCSVSFAPPLSTVNFLSALSVSNADITPAFSKYVSEYKASVPFEVAKLTVNALAEDGEAKVAVDSPELAPGAVTNVTVTVTAAAGGTRTYTIAVSREQDPNYVPSGDNTLAAIKVEGFLLSPAFEPGRLQYVVWLPFETTGIKVSAEPKDAKASVGITGGTNLEEGKDNVITVICKAENGDKKTYTVIAKRAAATEPGQTVPETTQPAKEAGPGAAQTEKTGMSVWLVVLIAVLCAAAGLLAGAVFPIVLNKIANK